MKNPLTYLSLYSIVTLAEYVKLHGEIKDTLSSYESIEHLNKKIYPILKELSTTEFFRYFKLNLHKECPFWPENFICTNRDCSVKLVESKDEQEDVDHMWNDSHLGTITKSSVQPKSPFEKSCNYSEGDFCVQDDLIDSVYVDLIKNPERYTGYAGDSSWKVWKAIYEQNCFKFVYGSKADHSLSDLGKILKPQEDQCLEKRAFFKVVSGLHSSISVHLCEQWLNRTIGEWGPNLQCFHDKVGAFADDRLQNLFYLYTIMAQAISSLHSSLSKYSFCQADKIEHLKTKDLLKQLFESISAQYPYIEEEKMFLEDLQLKKDFRDHFRNISRIMDCVGCEKCRLWGKIQVNGIGTAFKILFSDQNQISVIRNLKRTEIVSLFNAFGRFSESINALETFRILYSKNSTKEETGTGYDYVNSMIEFWYNWYRKLITL